MIAVFLAANAAAPPAPPWYVPVLTFLPMIVIIYFFLIRPQNAERKRLAEVRENLKPGDEIVLTNGILGKVVKVEKEFILVNVSANTNIRVLKSGIEAKGPFQSSNS